MNLLKYLVLRTILLAALALPEMSSAQVYFTDTGRGDVNVGFRKTGQYQEQYETMVYAGNVFTNFMALPAGTTTNITNYKYQDLTNMCPDNLGNLQWSAFASFSIGGSLSNSLGVFPEKTSWFTIPRANVNVQTTPVGRFSISSAGNLELAIVQTSAGTDTISRELSSTNVYNNTLVVLEPVSLDPANLLTAFIGDPNNSAYGDFGGATFSTYTVENTTPGSFTTPTVSDFYMDVPYTTGKVPIIDPLTGLPGGNADYLGYFTLNPNGSMTFTRAAAVSAPTVGTVSSTVTNGFSPLTVVFTNTATGSITNWVWNFGNGDIVTNTTGADVTNTYATGGDYSVTLTVYGPGGSSTVTLANYIVASPTPKISVALANSRFVLGGTNCPPGVQYRIFSSTSLALPLTSWQPVFTNTFLSNGSFSYTNATTNATSFFQLISP